VIVNKRDTGLVHAIGTWALAAAIINMLVGSAIFTVPASLSASLGPYAPLAFLVCAVSVGCVAICFAEGGSRLPTSGGPYGYIEAAFGPFVGAVMGTVYWVGNVLANGAVAAALADMVVSPLPVRFAAPVHAAVIIAVIGTVAVVNVGGAARGAKLVAAATVVKMAPLVLFVVVGAFAIHRVNFAVSGEPNVGGLGHALILAVFALMGAETPLGASGEVRHPSRTIPRALAVAMIAVALLYIAVQVVAQGILGPALAHSQSPLSDAMGRINPALRLLLLACGALSMLGWLSSDILGSPRIVFAFARDGLLPRTLGRVHGKYHTPHLAILFYAATGIGLALVGKFAELAVLSTLTGAVLYIAVCVAAWILARRGVALAGEPFNFPWLGTATVIGVTGMALLVALASSEEILGLLGILGASALIYQIVRWRSRVPVAQ
jgi:basic amino acid/polyamine antiporter, APA family